MTNFTIIIIMTIMNPMKCITTTINPVFFFILVSAFLPFAVTAQQLGSSLYILPPQTNPSVGSNFTLTVKVDSLETPINAAKGALEFNKDRLEIISVSKIGSLFNLWVEEPQFSNKDGMLRFQGGLPGQGFVGNGGTVLLIIFKAKAPGPAHLTWKDAEVLAADGKGSNILSDVQNLTFSIDEAFSAPMVEVEPAPDANKFLVWSNAVLAALFAFTLLFLAVRWMLRYHDIHAHHIFSSKKREDGDEERERERED